MYLDLESLCSVILQQAKSYINPGCKSIATTGNNISCSENLINTIFFSANNRVTSNESCIIVFLENSI